MFRISINKNKKDQCESCEKQSVQATRPAEEEADDPSTAAEAEICRL